MRDLTLENRIVVSPMCQYASLDGSATDWHLMHYGSLSVGAAGLLMIEMTNVSLEGRISPRCATLCSDANEHSLKRIVDFCRANGVAKLGVQLAHAGRKASVRPPAEGGTALLPEDGGWKPVAPSAIAFSEGWPVPRELSVSDLKRLIDDHVASVERADRLGFDVIELHSGHGYLIHQFLSPLSNQRHDEFGGSLENRMRFPLETFRAMRAAWPAGKPMGVRLSVTDWVLGGWSEDEAVVFARALKDVGCDFIDATTGGLDPRQAVPLAAGYQTPFSHRIRRDVKIPTMTVGLIDSARQANEIVASERADFVVIGRGALYDPRWAWHAAEELGDETSFAPKYRACHPSLRPQLFRNHHRI